MTYLLYYGIPIIFLIAIIIICIIARVKNLKLFDFVSLEFFPETNSVIKVSSKAKFGIVVSSDGKVYKTQLETLIKLNSNSAFCNANLFISGIGWFVYRQQFQALGNSRVPKTDQILLDCTKINELNIEFERKEGWKPIELEKKEYKCLLKIKLLDQTIKHKFTFQVREQNMTAIQSTNPGQPTVLEVPIIKN